MNSSNPCGRQRQPGPGSNPRLGVEELLKVRFEDVCRLARWMGVKYEHLLDKPNAHWRVACAIIRWNKRNPQSRAKS